MDASIAIFVSRGHSCLRLSLPRLRPGHAKLVIHVGAECPFRREGPSPASAHPCRSEDPRAWLGALSNSPRHGGTVRLKYQPCLLSPSSAALYTTGGIADSYQRAYASIEPSW